MSERNSVGKRIDRYQALLAFAQRLLIEGGLPGLTIERLAKLAGYSRPTVYDHFESKNAIVEALAWQNLEVTRDLIEKASNFEGTSREKAFGLVLAYEVLARFHPVEFHMTDFLSVPWVRTQLPEAIAKDFASMVSRYTSTVREQFELAAAAGELTIAAGLSVGNVVFHSLSMSYGIYSSILKERISFALSEPIDPWAEARISLHRYWDGIGWEREREGGGQVAVADRFMREVFPEHWVELQVEALREQAGIAADS
jgi:AcrR family transcriptional regulator